MSGVVIPAPPGDVPECEPKAAGRSFVTGVRAAAVGASDAADVMRDNAAPEDWKGDAAEVANHSMTATADDLDGAVAAMQKVVTAGDRFFDRLDRLLDRRQELVTRRTYLVSDRLELKLRAESYDVETEEAGLQEEARDLERRIGDLDGDVTTWQQDLTSAEDDFIAALQAVDTVAEGDSAAAAAPDTGPLAQRAAELQDDPAAMNRWWESLTPAQREALKISHPELVGNSDGIPVTDRDDANRANLSEDLNTLLQKQKDGELSGAEERRLERLEGIYRSMQLAEQGQGVVDPSTGELVRPYLLMFEPDEAHGDGMAALSWGNPDTADHVSVNVPGFSSTMDNFDGVSEDALNVFNEAAYEGNGSVASVAWLGYDAPSFSGLGNNPIDFFQGVYDGSQVAEEDYARAGASNLSDFIDGLRTTDQGADSHMTVIGHSYGSTTVGIASGEGLPVDNTVLVGSPGPGDENDHASDLSGDVYVGSASNDFVTRLGNPTDEGLGNDPANEDFGAHRFQVDNVTDGISMENHTSYFDRNSTSVDSIGRIVAGNGDEVEEIEGRGFGSNGQWWLEQTPGYQQGEWLVDRADDLVDAIPRPTWPF